MLKHEKAINKVVKQHSLELTEEIGKKGLRQPKPSETILWMKRIVKFELHKTV